MKRKHFVIISIVIALFMTTFIYIRYINHPPIIKQYRIGATYMNMNNSFYKAINDEVKKMVDMRDDILITRDAVMDVDEQVKQINSMIDNKVQVLIINPVDGTSTKIMEAISKAKKLGIKIIAVDAQFKDSSLADCTIISDNYGAGKLCAKHMMKKLDHSKILLIEHKGALSAEDRIRGFLDEIKNDDHYKVVARVDSQGATEKAMPKVSDVIKEKVNFDVVMALNDPSALGALAAMDKARIARRVLVFGVDGSPDMKRLIKTSGEVEATAAQSPISMGSKAVKAAYDLIDKKHVKSKIGVPIYLITNENISKYDVSGWQ